MSNPLGFSVYVSSFEKQVPMLEQMKNQNRFIFTSLHIAEEVDATYVDKVIKMCHWLADKGFQIIADVSPKTLAVFEQDDLFTLAKDLHLSVLRVDYGFDNQQITKLAEQISIAYNASTLDDEIPSFLDGSQAYAMHNFYPRPETGLDWGLFTSINQTIQSQASVQVIAFIPGDEERRGPIQQGLPTVEAHRNVPPYVAYLDMMKNSTVDQVFIGDIKISATQLQLIEAYGIDGVIAVPVSFVDEYQYLYDQEFTIRVDSPHGLMRLQESRAYANQGAIIEPQACLARLKGHVTIDNKNYQRYSGEIQILRESYPQDKRVNVIGQLNEGYLTLLNCIKNGDKIRFVQP